MTLTYADETASFFIQRSLSSREMQLNLREINRNSVGPCAKYLQAISEFPTSQNIRDVCSLFELINQVSYAFSMAERMLPFRQLLKHDAPFIWTNELKDIFQESKSAIISEIEKSVQIFYPRKPTFLQMTGPEQALDFSYYKNTAPAQNSNHFAVKQDGKSHLLGADSHTLLNHDMHQSREKHLPWLMPWTKQDTSS